MQRFVLGVLSAGFSKSEESLLTAFLMKEKMTSVSIHTAAALSREGELLQVFCMSFLYKCMSLTWFVSFGCAERKVLQFRQAIAAIRVHRVSKLQGQSYLF